MSGEEEDRKAKLAALRAKAKRKKAGGEGGEGEGEVDGEGEGELGDDKRHIKFRNYQPYDASLGGADNPAPVPPATSGKHKEPEMSVIQKELEQFKTEELNVVPKKPNWDLKSQVEGKLEKLKRRTQRAIVDMLREKMAKEAEA